MSVESCLWNFINDLTFDELVQRLIVEGKDISGKTISELKELLFKTCMDRNKKD